MRLKRTRDGVIIRQLEVSEKEQIYNLLHVILDKNPLGQTLAIRFTERHQELLYVHSEEITALNEALCSAKSALKKKIEEGDPSKNVRERIGLEHIKNFVKQLQEELSQLD